MAIRERPKNREIARPFRCRGLSATTKERQQKIRDLGGCQLRIALSSLEPIFPCIPAKSAYHSQTVLPSPSRQPRRPSHALAQSQPARYFRCRTFQHGRRFSVVL